MRRVVSAIVCCALFSAMFGALLGLSGGVGAHAQTAPTDTTIPTDAGEGQQPDSTGVGEAPTIPPVSSTIPIGCDPLIVPQAIIVATFTAMDGPDGKDGKPNTNPRLASTTRFTISEVRSGSIDGYGDGKQLDIDFGVDKQFLKLNHPYLIAFAVNPVTQTLVSKFRIPPADFGGNQVVDAKPDNCPKVVDTIITTEVNGKSVDTGILSRFTSQKKQIAWAFIEPTLAVFAVLVALVLIKHFWLAIWRSTRRLRHRVRRVVSRGGRAQAAAGARRAEARAAKAQLKAEQSQRGLRRADSTSSSSERPDLTHDDDQLVPNG